MYVPERRTLAVGDNLQVMAGLAANSVGLIYMDPPFNSGRDFDITLTQSASDDRRSVQRAFSDRWSTGQAAELLYRLNETVPRRVLAVLKGFAEAELKSDVLAYLVAMAPRLCEAHRVLSDTGSLYLHCDPSASHYLKILLDVIFGRENFRNEVIWKRTHAHSSSKRYGPVHDSILFYSKSAKFVWHSLRTQYTDEYVRKYYRSQDQDGLYQLITCTGPGDRAGTRAHYEWRGVWPPVGRHWCWTKEHMEDLDAQGRLVHSPNGIPRFKRYLHEGGGVVLQDLWTDIDRLDAHSDERVGFETQKPLALLERVIAASSNPGDVVLDPYCGSGTTLVAAERMGRAWVGVDVSTYAAGLALGRVKQELGESAVEMIGLPASPQDALRLRESDPLAYGVWGAGMLSTIPVCRDLERGVVTGTGTPRTNARRECFASWIPLRDNYDYKVPETRRKPFERLDLVLRADRAVDPLVRWIRGHQGVSRIREVTLAELFAPGDWTIHDGVGH